MTRSILIASGKGGVGKSTVASRLGRILSAQGKKILLVDCDAGLSSLDVMLGLSEDVAFNWYDAYTGRCEIEEAVIHNENGPDLLPAPRMPLEEAAHDAVRQAAEALADDYDIVLIDAPAGLSAGLERAAAAAKKAIVVATADDISVRGAAALAELVRNRGVEQCRLLINRYDIRAAKKGKLLTVDELIDRTCVRLLGIIPEDPAITYSTVTGAYSPKSKSAAAFRRIAFRIEGQNVPLKLKQLR